jgi:hypothetical protein
MMVVKNAIGTDIQISLNELIDNFMKSNENRKHDSIFSKQMQIILKVICVNKFAIKNSILASLIEKKVFKVPLSLCLNICIPIPNKYDENIM